MKSRGLYEIHALIGRCHLHYKKRASFSVTLKIGNKASASTQFKVPVNDEINFNTELILKVDKAYFQGPGKLSIIVTMVTQEQQKKIIGSCISQFRQKGMQSCRISQCGCNQKGLEVMVEFEVVNIQNQNNNLNNNKFQSPNNSDMKDLKKTLTISREKQLVKSSKLKPNTATKSGAEKTQIKVSRQNKDRNMTNGLSPNLSSLTTKISSPQIKHVQQTKDSVPQLLRKIMQLERKLKASLKNESFHRKQVSSIRDEMEILRKENECLIQILKFEQEKSSAAITYISYMSKQVVIQQKDKAEYHEYFQLVQSLKLEKMNDTSFAIEMHNNQQKNQQKLIKINQIYQTEEEEQKIENEKSLEEIQDLKRCINQLRHQIFDFQEKQNYKNQSITQLQQTVVKLNKQNAAFKIQIQKLQDLTKICNLKIKSLQSDNQELQLKITENQKALENFKQKFEKIEEKLKNQIDLNSNILQQKLQLKNQLITADKKINQIKQYQQKFEQLSKQHDKLKNSVTKTPLESQIYPRKSRFQDGQEIQNLINQMNGCSKQNDQKNLLLASRQANDKDSFLARNKSESLLKDLQIDPDSQEPNTQQTSKQICRASYKNKQQSMNKTDRKFSIPQPKKQAKIYNYQYDVDSLNYFNNFEENHDGIQLSGPEDNVYEIEPDFQGKV